jgi:hypothetical protein
MGEEGYCLPVVFPLLSIACFMAGSFILLTRALLIGVELLIAHGTHSGED